MGRYKYRACCWALPVLLFLAVVPASRGEEGLVGVAAGIAPCVEELLSQFGELGNGELSLAKSPCSALASQLLSGASFGMIIFSEPRWADWLEEEGRILKRRVLSLHPLALWWVKEGPPGVEVLISGRIACPLPETTAFGALAKQYLLKEGLWDRLVAEDRLIFVRGAPQAAFAVAVGAAEAAFLPVATTLTPGCSRGKAAVLPVPPIEQVAVLLPGASWVIRRFYDFCGSEAAMPIWKHWGFYETD